jgi:hypothetical protein
MIASLLFLLFLSLVIAALVAAVAASSAQSELAANALFSTALCGRPNFETSAASRTPSKTSVGITRTNELADTQANSDHRRNPSITNRTTIKLEKGGAITA